MMLPFSDELISAYLDGELSAQERQYVEAQLRENADLRRLCDELGMLRVLLQAMPAATPPENLAERVLRQAERRMLGGDEQHVAARGEPPTVPCVAAPASGRHWRLAVALFATLAACVLAAIGLPWYAGRPFAQARKNENELDRVPQATHNERLTYQAPPDTAAPSDNRAAEGREPLAVGLAVPDSAAPSGDSAAVQPLAAAAPAAPPPVAESTGPDMDNPETATTQETREAAPMPYRFYSSVPQGGMGSAGGGLGGSLGSAGGMGSGMPGGGPGVAERGSAGALSGMGRGSDSAEKRERLQAGQAAPAQPLILGGGLTEPGAAPAAAPQDTVESTTELTDRAHENRQAIEQLTAQLSRGQMALVKLHVPESRWLESLDQLRTLERDTWPAIAPGEASPKDAALPPGAEASSEAAASRLARDLEENLAEPNQTLLVVSGSPAQIHQALVDLAAQPGVTIESAPHELSLVRDRWLSRSGHAIQQRLGLAESPHRAQADEEAGTASLKARTFEPPAGRAREPDHRPVQPAKSAYTDPMAGARDGQAPARGREEADGSETMKTVYVFCRVVPDTPPPASTPTEETNGR